MKEEQRKFPRFDVTAKIRVQKINGAGVVNDAFVKNISAEGFCFYSREQLSPGDTIDIEIIEEKAEEAPIRTKGEVVWCSKDKDSQPSPHQGAFLIGVKVLGIRKTDEARFAMLYCERMLAELKSFLRM